MQAIVTKTHGATDTKGERISATNQAGRIYVGRDYELDGVGNHAMACRALMKKCRWVGVMHGGGLPNGDMAWVFIDGPKAVIGWPTPDES